MGGCAPTRRRADAAVRGELFWTLKGERRGQRAPQAGDARDERAAQAGVAAGGEGGARQGERDHEGLAAMRQMIEVGAFFTTTTRSCVRSVFVDVEAMEAPPTPPTEALGIVKAARRTAARGDQGRRRVGARPREGDGGLRPSLGPLGCCCARSSRRATPTRTGRSTSPSSSALAANQGAAAVSMQAALFATADLNKDAKLTVDEFLKANPRAARLSDDGFKAQGGARGRHWFADAKRSTKRRPSCSRNWASRWRRWPSSSRRRAGDDGVAASWTGSSTARRSRRAPPTRRSTLPGAPPIPVGAMLQMMKGVKDAFPTGGWW